MHRWYDAGTTYPLAVTVGTVSRMPRGMDTVWTCTINFSDCTSLDHGENTIVFFLSKTRSTHHLVVLRRMTGELELEVKRSVRYLPRNRTWFLRWQKGGVRHPKKGIATEKTHVSRLHMVDASIGTGRGRKTLTQRQSHGGGNG